MDSTTARIAGKHAKFSLRITNVHPDGMARIDCRLHADPRLIAGASAIVAHVAHRAGLADDAANELSRAAAKACEELARAISGNSSNGTAIQLSAAEFPDRVEVTVAPVSAASERAKSPETPRQIAEKLREKLKSASTESLSVEWNSGIPQITLVKNLSAAKRRFLV
jgi:hypothetical protein